MKFTIEEKVKLLDGLDVWHTKSIQDLPSIMMSDGPHGLRKQYESKDNLGVFGSIPATCFPTASLVACSFDKKLLNHMGHLIANEAKANEVNIVLGPGINMKRTPLCGRNFEYYSEDPYLAGELGSSFVLGVENQGIGTSVKHFFANNQEKNRFFINSVVDERALREIYLKAFERVVKNNPATVMASYNKINGYYATEHPYLQKILRKEWGYYGVVVSDWGAVHNRINSVKASTDLEMPSSYGHRTKEVLKEINQDEALRIAVNKSSDRIIELVKKYKINEKIEYDVENHHEEAKKIASESMVLLKNHDVLPINKDEKVLIVGGFVDQMRFQGGGSSNVNPTKIDQISELYQKYSKNIQISKGYHLNKDSKDQELIEEAVSIAKEVDKVIFLFGLPDSKETEGFDRTTLDIPNNQIELLKKLHEVNQNLVGVAIAGSVINLSFEHKYLKGLLLAYLGGQASAGAILDILFGKVNPSGRLAETWIDDINECNVKLTNDNHSVYYDESIYIGYRYYQSYNKRVHYPFGYGLSYTTFLYSDLKIAEKNDEFIISMKIKNTGLVKGKEVIQIYIENNKTTVYKAKKELKAFDKIELNANEEKEISIALPKKSFEYYDIYKQKFIIEKGKYQILVAKNVCDEIEAFEVNIAGEEVHHPSNNYQKYQYDTSDFEKIYQKELPLKNIKKRRPYNLSSTLEDLSQTLIGKMISKIIIKEGLKSLKDAKNDWVLEMAKKTLLETPIQMLALFSSGKVTFNQAQGLVDIVNLKMIKGLKKLKSKKQGELND
jgi:beta-glucosidase